MSVAETRGAVKGATSGSTAGVAQVSLPGFHNLVLDGQACFRVALEAMSHPGRIVEMPVTITAPPPLESAGAALCLTLLDSETRLWCDASLDVAPLRDYLRFHCATPLVSTPQEADFALLGAPAETLRLDQFDIGEDQYPDRSATAICLLPSLREGTSMRLRGPGIKDSQEVRLAGLPEDFAQQWAHNQALYPLGVDLFFVSGNACMALPRSIVVEG